MALNPQTAEVGEMVSITKKRYEQLLDRERLLRCLEASGVDSWEGYYYATREYYGDEDWMDE
jgi:hypothetical protein